ncbi:MAG TPA: signal peptidase I [Thermomicrobiales bacterium]|jgi:signal peptidase I|nr:signal peptidase I [Thermomicrobiales bacterium]
MQSPSHLPTDQRNERLATDTPAPAAAETVATSEHTKTARQKSGVRVFREIAETILLAVLLYFAVRAVVMPYEVDGASMEPNLTNHERVLVNRVAYWDFDLNGVLNWIPGVDRSGEWVWTPFGDLSRGDVIVLEPPVAHDQPYIKRVIGLPGDEITFDEGYVYVNGVQLDEQYIDGPITECSTRDINGANPCDLTVPADSVYVLGDNRDNSADSRVFGTVRIDDINGKAFFSNWPMDRIGPIGHGDYGDAE